MGYVPGYYDTIIYQVKKQDRRLVFTLRLRITIYNILLNKNIMSTSSWSLDPLLHASLPEKVYESAIANLTFVQSLYLITLLLSVTYPLVHKLLLKYFEKYNDIKPASKQTVVLHHAVEALVLSIAFPFFTYYMVKVNFQVHEKEEIDVVMSSIRSIICLSTGFMVMYMMELASRYEDPRPIILFHHLLSCLDGFLIAVFPTDVMVKTGAVLVYFICFEALTFAGLFMYRIFPNSKATPKVIVAGMVIFGATRPLQLLWVGTAVFGSWDDENMVKWQAVMQIIVTVVLTVLQVWTLKIHYGIWKRCTSTSTNKQTDSSIEGTQNMIIDNTFHQATLLVVQNKATSSSAGMKGSSFSFDVDEESALSSDEDPCEA